MPETSRAICASEGRVFFTSVIECFCFQGAFFATQHRELFCERYKSDLCDPVPRPPFGSGIKCVLCTKPPGANFATQYRELFLRAIQERFVRAREECSLPVLLNATRSDLCDAASRGFLYERCRVLFMSEVEQSKGVVN